MSVSTTTYTIRLCKTGKEFKCIPNVADDCRPRPAMGKVIDEKWRVLGRIANSVSEILLDVEDVSGVSA
jgi:hypothetical protein